MKGPILAVLSGPEPQRTIFEKLILKQLDTSDPAAFIIRGIPEQIVHAESGTRVKMLAHMTPDELSQAITMSQLVVCRSGYSSLMDMSVLGKKEVLVVPTPGQTEQEYLAARLYAKGWFNTQEQKDLNLNSALLHSNNFTGIPLETGESLLEEQLLLLNLHLKDAAANH